MSEKQKEIEEMTEESNKNQVFIVMRGITEYLERVSDAAVGEGPTLLDYAHIMDLVDGLDRDKMRMLLWAIMPRFLQGAADMAQVGARASRSAESMRIGYLPVGVPPCRVADDGAVDLKVVLRNSRLDFETVKLVDSTNGAEPTSYGCCHLSNAKGQEYLVLHFAHRDIGDWFKEWLNESHKDDSCETAPRGISFGLGLKFSFDDPNPLEIKSRGWRDEPGEIQLRWDGGVALFHRVLVVSVREHLSDVSEGGDSHVFVTFLLDGPWDYENLDGDDGDGEENDDDVE